MKFTNSKRTTRTSKTAEGTKRMYTFSLTKNVENPVTGKKVERKATVNLPEITGENGTNDPTEALNNALAACNGDSLALVKWFEHGVRAQAKQVAANSLLTFGDSDTKKALRDFSDAVKIAVDLMDIPADEARKLVASKPKFKDMAAKVSEFERTIAENPTNTFDFTDLANLKTPRWFGGEEEEEEVSDGADGATK